MPQQRTTYWAHVQWLSPWFYKEHPAPGDPPGTQQRIGLLRLFENGVGFGKKFVKAYAVRAELPRNGLEVMGVDALPPLAMARAIRDKVKDDGYEHFDIERHHEDGQVVRFSRHRKDRDRNPGAANNGSE